MKKSCVACGAEDKPLVPLTNSTPLRVMEMDYDLNLGICFDCLVARLDLDAIHKERLELICQGAEGKAGWPERESLAVIQTRLGTCRKCSAMLQYRAFKRYQ